MKSRLLNDAPAFAQTFSSGDLARRISLFWSVTVYDPDTRSEIQTDQGQAALRSLFELKDETSSRLSFLRRPIPT